MRLLALLALAALLAVGDQNVGVIGRGVPQAPPSGGGGGAGSTVGTVTFNETGWATFGLAIPRSTCATTGVKVGVLTTQTDVKATWDDGSLKHVIYTANIPATGVRTITCAADPGGTLTPTWPSSTKVDIVVAGNTRTATLPAFSSADCWLSGALLRECRSIQAFSGATGASAELRTIFDVRSYTDGGTRVDITVANSRDVSTAAKVTYDVTETVSGSSVFTSSGLVHYYLKRWRKTFATGGLTLVRNWAPSMTPYQQAAAIPKWRSDIAAAAWTLTGANFGPLGDQSGAGTRLCGLNNYSGNAGGHRADLGPYPAWVAQWVTSPTTNGWDAVISSADLYGCLPFFWTDTDSVSIFKLDDWNGARLLLNDDVRIQGGDTTNYKFPAGTVDFTDPMYPSLVISHGTRPVYPAYLFTGDRYYRDVMVQDAAWQLGSLYASAACYCRTGTAGTDRSLGVVHPEDSARAVAWLTARLSDAAFILPDSDTYKTYFNDKLQNNLNNVETLAAGDTTTLKTTLSVPVAATGQPAGQMPTGFVGDFLFETGHLTWFESAYVDWAIDWAKRRRQTTNVTFRTNFTNLWVSYINYVIGATTIADCCIFHIRAAPPQAASDTSAPAYFASLAAMYAGAHSLPEYTVASIVWDAPSGRSTITTTAPHGFVVPQYVEMRDASHVIVHSDYLTITTPTTTSFTVGLDFTGQGVTYVTGSMSKDDLVNDEYGSEAMMVADIGVAIGTSNASTVYTALAAYSGMLSLLTTNPNDIAFALDMQNCTGCGVP